MSPFEIIQLRKAFAALVFVLSLTFAHAARQNLETVHLRGQDYIPLANWAGMNNLNWFWLDGDMRVEATNILKNGQRSSMYQLDGEKMDEPEYFQKAR